MHSKLGTYIDIDDNSNHVVVTDKPSLWNRSWSIMPSNDSKYPSSVIIRNFDGSYLWYDKTNSVVNGNDGYLGSSDRPSFYWIKEGSKLKNYITGKYLAANGNKLILSNTGDDWIFRNY